MVQRVRRVLIASLIGLGFHTSTWAAGLEAGRPLPELQFTNVQGERVDSNQYADWVQIFTFADQKSSTDLINWMDEAGPKAMLRYPEARFAFLSFADVTAVPEMFRTLVATAIAEVDKRSRKKMLESYQQRGVALDPNRAAFHLTPDWDGTWLNTFQIEDAHLFYCWLVYQGRVIARYQGDSPDLQAQFLSDLDLLLSPVK